MYPTVYSLETEGIEPNIEDLDRVCNGLQNPNNNRIATAFRGRSDAFQYCPIILDGSHSPQAKTMALNILKDFIQNRWEFNEEESLIAEIREYMYSNFLRYCQILGSGDAFMRIFSEVVSWIIIREWPDVNPDIIDEMVEQFITNRTTAANGMYFLNNLCRNIFDPNDQIVYSRQNELKNLLWEKGPVIFKLVIYAFENRTDVELVKSALDTMHYFVEGLPPEIILDNGIFEIVILELLPKSEFVAPSLFFLQEVFSQKEIPEAILDNTTVVFEHLMTKLYEILNPDAEDFETNSYLNSYAFKALVQCLSTFILDLGHLIETPELADHIQLALRYLFRTVGSGDVLTNKLATDFWTAICRRCVKEISAPSEPVEQLYAPFFPDLRRRLIECIQKPEAIILAFDETSNEVVREKNMDATLKELFNSQKQCMVYLTNLDNADMVEAIMEYVTALGASGFEDESFKQCCYSVGAISGTLREDVESEFIMKVLGVLLEISDSSSGNSYARAIVAGGVMYVISQYPRFLGQNMSFVWTINEKLFEFMHSENIAVREMAVNSLSTIAQSRASRLYHSGDKGEHQQTLIETMIDSIDDIVGELNDDVLVERFFGACGVIIQNTSEKRRQELIGRLMEQINVQWDSHIAAFDPTNEEYTTHLLFLLNTNLYVAQGVTSCFSQQVGRIFSQMLEVYQQYYALVAEIAQSNPEYCQGMPEFRAYNEVRAAVVNILSTFMQRTSNVNAIAGEIIGPIMDTIVAEYQTSPPLARIPEVIDLIRVMCDRLYDKIGERIPDIFGTVFAETWQMFDPQFEQFLSFRQPFYKFLAVIVKRHFSVMLSAPPDAFAEFIQAINYGAEHTLYEVYSIALEITMQIITSIKGQNQQTRDHFYSTYFVPLLAHTFMITADTKHIGGFDLEVKLLRQMMMTQTGYLNSGLITEAIASFFPRTAPEDLQEGVEQLIGCSADQSTFGIRVRDFLTITKRFSRRDKNIDPEAKAMEVAEEELMKVNGVIGLDGPEWMDQPEQQE